MSELSSKLVPLRGKLLAVTAPGSIVLNEDIIVIINDNFLEILSDNSLNRLAVISGNILTLKERLERARLEVVNKLVNGINSEAFNAAWEGILLHVVCGVENSDSGEG